MYWEDYSQHMLDKCKELGIPYFACFELTPFCNLNCNMCYIRLTPKQAAAQGKLLTTNEWICLGEQAKRMGVVTLEITGGEPTIRPDFSILYEAYAKLGFLIKLRTNGYSISGEVLELLKRYRPYQVSITMYGASNESYRKICGVGDGYHVVTNNIVSLQDIGIQPRLTMTLTKDNVSDVHAVKEWAGIHGLPLSTFGGLITPVRNANRSIEHLKLRYSDAECDIPADESASHHVTNRTKYMNPFWMCRGVGSQFCISWDGRMYLCNGLTDIWSDPKEFGLEKAFDELNKRIHQLRRPKECESCPYIEWCGACPSRLLSATQHSDQTCEEICRIARRNYKFNVLNTSFSNTVMEEIDNENQRTICTAEDC